MTKRTNTRRAFAVAALGVAATSVVDNADAQRAAASAYETDQRQTVMVVPAPNADGSVDSLFLRPNRTGGQMVAASGNWSQGRYTLVIPDPKGGELAVQILGFNGMHGTSLSGVHPLCLDVMTAEQARAAHNGQTPAPQTDKNGDPVPVKTMSFAACTEERRDELYKAAYRRQEMESPLYRAIVRRAPQDAYDAFEDNKVMVITIEETSRREAVLRGLENGGLALVLENWRDDPACRREGVRCDNGQNDLTLPLTERVVDAAGNLMRLGAGETRRIRVTVTEAPIETRPVSNPELILQP